LESTIYFDHAENAGSEVIRFSALLPGMKSQQGEFVAGNEKKRAARVSLVRKS